MTQNYCLEFSQEPIIPRSKNIDSKNVLFAWRFFGRPAHYRSFTRSPSLRCVDTMDSKWNVNSSGDAHCHETCSRKKFHFFCKPSLKNKIFRERSWCNYVYITYTYMYNEKLRLSMTEQHLLWLRINMNFLLLRFGWFFGIGRYLKWNTVICKEIEL